MGEDKGNGGFSSQRLSGWQNRWGDRGHDSPTWRLDGQEGGGKEKGRTDTDWEGKGRGHRPAERRGQTEEEGGRVVIRMDVEKTGPQGRDSGTGQR